MKTKLIIIGFALTGFVLTSCSSSMYMSKASSTPTDDIYYTPSKSTTIVANETSKQTNNASDNSGNSSAFKLAELEKKYSKVLADTGNIDTTVYKAKSSNPYENILSNSYQDSYERRLKGMEDPWYGMNNYGVYNSNAYFYASAYDPAFYNTVVMGSQVWVEPWYISSLFFWPRSHFRFGFGLSLWNPIGYSWYNDYYYPQYYWDNPYYYGLGSYGYFNDYYNGYYPGIYYRNYSNIEYYGRRPNNSTNITSTSLRNGTSYESQIVASHRRNGNITTRNTNQTEIISRNGQRNNNQEVLSRNNRNSNLNTTRLRSEGITRNLNMTEPTRRNNNTNYQRPRSTNNDDYIRTSTRNQNISNGTTTRDIYSRNNSTIRENRNASSTYNRPNRVGTSTERERTTTSGNVNRESSFSRPSSSSSNSSSSSTRSSSGSQQSSSSGSGERRR